MRPSFFHHLHPPTIPAAQARWRYTLGAGGLLVFLTLVLIATGILEMFYYVPTPEGAGASIQALTFLVPYGAVVRNLHYWAAQAMVVVAFIHLLRVVLTGAYAAPRRFNYLLGLGLLVLALFLDFTGYVLRWDEGVRWALVAGTNLVRSIPLAGESLYGMAMGGGRPGAATLTRFYAWHTFGLSLALVGIGVWHIFRVRRDGGIAVPPAVVRRKAPLAAGEEREADSGEPKRITRFELVRREVLAMVLASAVLLLLATFFPAPLAQPMLRVETPPGTEIDSRAPWFFLWVQQLLKYGGPFAMGVLIPLGVLVFLGLLPYILPAARPEELGRWLPRGNRLAQALVIALALTVLGLTLAAALSA